MTMDEKRQKQILNSLYSSIKAFNQSNLFSIDDKKIVDLCSEYLRFKGYKVTAPVTEGLNINKLDDLIYLFYSKLSMKRGAHAEEIGSYHQQGRDLSIASAFVNNRMELTGSSFKNALQECGAIIEVVIDYEDEFNFRYILNSFSVFGQKNLKWVTDKAIDIMNRKIDRRAEQEKEAVAERVIAAQDTSDLGYTDLDALVRDLEEAERG